MEETPTFVLAVAAVTVAKCLYVIDGSSGIELFSIHVILRGAIRQKKNVSSTVHRTHLNLEDEARTRKLGVITRPRGVE